MVRISQHKQQQKEELKGIKIRPNKYNFSPKFTEKIHRFSEEHHKDYFKTFNRELEIWSIEHKDDIASEIISIKMAGFEGTDYEIVQKIKISARFYYRKKSKKEQNEKLKKKQESPKESNESPKESNENQKIKKNKEKKPYIGLSQPFIICMDEYIKDELLRDAENIKRKAMFSNFTSINIESIKSELEVLREKYYEGDVAYEPKEIAEKIKKAFENRFYTFASGKN